MHYSIATIHKSNTITLRQLIFFLIIIFLLPCGLRQGEGLWNQETERIEIISEHYHIQENQQSHKILHANQAESASFASPVNCYGTSTPVPACQKIYLLNRSLLI